MYETKDIGGSPLDIDDKSRTVKVVISKVGNQDSDGDVIAPGAWDKTIAERGPKGAGLIWMLTDHMPSMKYAISRFSDLAMEGDNLVGTSKIPNTTWGNDVLELYKSGNINQHSVGFSPVDTEKNGDTGLLIKQAMLYEGSAVLWGANPQTPTISVGKSERTLKGMSDEQQFDYLIKAMRSGDLTDEQIELHAIRLEQLKSKYLNIQQGKTTKAADTPAPPPVSSKTRKFAEALYLQTI